MAGPYVVTHDDTALALGSGDVPVLATPRLIAWLEAATVEATVDLPDGDTSVGTRVDVEHLLASPVGAAVTAHAQVVHRDDRLVRFEVTAFHDLGDGPVLVAHGHVTRVVVNREKFFARSTPALIIRPAVPSEWAATGELVVDAYRTGYGLSGASDDYAHVVRDVAGRAGHSEVLVALEGDRLIGSVTLLQPGTPMAEVCRPGEMEFRFMGVDPAAWGRGVARALVESVIARAGVRTLVCSVIEGNEPAAALYRSCGFTAAPDRDWVPVPGVMLRVFVRPPEQPVRGG
ncbi:MAG: thioesterase, FlK family [Actinomycetota bacterium]